MDKIIREVVQDTVLPAPFAIGRVQARRIVIPPNTPSGAHVHNGPVFGSIEAGSAIYQITGQPERVLAVGDVFYEPADVRIERFDGGPDGVTFLAFFPVPAGVEPELRPA